MFLLTTHITEDRVMSIKVWDLNLALSLVNIDRSCECLLVDLIFQHKLKSIIENIYNISLDVSRVPQQGGLL